MIGSLPRRHRAEEFKKFLVKLDREVPDEPDLHLTCDIYATHNAPESWPHPGSICTSHRLARSG
ncbi:hypothetical protein QF035_002306 [Streptomyces umbrinus]|uniref:Transposase n=1 Tax=Streptomyces umbrinus TaxID=67370 RepID=A0ABU0SMC7_9ACTN|nr:hypothetical protein [Streptomyces umbrinus]